MPTREEQKLEAVKRMKIMKVFGETIRQFDKDGYVSVSEPPFGAFFWVDEEQEEFIKEFEKEHNALVYMGVLSITEFGRMVNWFYVSQHQDEWEDDKESMKEKEACVYVQNVDDEFCSEFGYIGFKRSPAAGVLRIW